MLDYGGVATHRLSPRPLEKTRLTRRTLTSRKRSDYGRRIRRSCQLGGLTQCLADKGDALAALRLAAERPVHHRHRTTAAGDMRMQVTVANGVAEADIHGELSAAL